MVCRESLLIRVGMKGKQCLEEKSSASINTTFSDQTANNHYDISASHCLVAVVTDALVQVNKPY